MIDTRIIKHNNTTLKWIREEINKGQFNNEWIKIKISENGKIITIKSEKDLKINK